jgi:hypothetical protein
MNELIKFSDIKIGQFFTIGETPSYPKLKTKYGYIDVRDTIKKQTRDISMRHGFRIMSTVEVLNQFKQYDYKTVKEITNLTKHLLKK